MVVRATCLAVAVYKEKAIIYMKVCMHIIIYEAVIVYIITCVCRAGAGPASQAIA